VPFEAHRAAAAAKAFHQMIGAAVYQLRSRILDVA
jgi:hypothetical protein